ncbi:AAA family ATPase [Xylanimonas sp. McL0601]|uniref:AAA family ATPase n=1 Tax=Xylanimonas sp. McL0601 TaxID=3414739 RepID=UPI003CF7EF73
MLVWINGTFGVGKTTLATHLSEHWHDAVVVDPERVGMMLMEWSKPHGLGTADFQDFALWRELVVSALAGFHAEPGRPMIVPMTVLNPAYYEQIVGGLRAQGIDVHHFCLTAPPQEIARRLATRQVPGQEGRSDFMDWALTRLERYTPAMSDPRFETFLDATLPPDELLAELLERLPDPLPATVRS